MYYIFITTCVRKPDWAHPKLDLVKPESPRVLRNKGNHAQKSRLSPDFGHGVQALKKSLLKAAAMWWRDTTSEEDSEHSGCEQQSGKDHLPLSLSISDRASSRYAAPTAYSSWDEPILGCSNSNPYETTIQNKRSP